MDSPAFGAEGTCTEIVGSVAVVDGAAGTPDRVIIGAVPFRALNIPSEATFDGWGRRLTYAVTRDLTRNVTPRPIPDPSAPIFGEIAFVDPNGGSRITPNGTGAYALISHGENGLGAYSASGGAVGLTCTGNTHEVENCNDDATFMFANYRATQDAMYYDDKALVAMSLQKTEDGIPTCPAGQTLVSNGTGYVCQAALPSCPVGQTLTSNGTGYACQVANPIFLPHQTEFRLAGGAFSGSFGYGDHVGLISGLLATGHCNVPHEAIHTCPTGYSLVKMPDNGQSIGQYMGCLLNNTPNPYGNAVIVGQIAIEPRAASRDCTPSHQQ